MEQNRTKCVIILSAKSSGSTALQNLLVRYPHVSHVRKTRHQENETLYWAKAASVLGLPQVDMVDSEVPIPPQQARNDLIRLLADNLGDSYVPPDDDRELIFDGWRQLCRQYAPVFVEKSPHHLCQWSALELIVKCIQESSGIEFLLIGLVRNPMDTLYSTWRRWRGLPEQNQDEWYVTYRNLLKLEELASEWLFIIRYEDMIRDPTCITKVHQFIGVTDYDDAYLHRRSLGKWKRDRLYGFQLSEKVTNLAQQYGYSEYDMANDGHLLWPLHRQTSRWFHHRMGPAKPVLRALKNLTRQTAA